MRSTQEQCIIFRGIRSTVHFKFPLIAYLYYLDVNDRERPAAMNCVAYVMNHSPQKEQTIAYVSTV